MREFKWIDWNRAKIEAHALSTEEVEAAFGRAIRQTAKDDQSYELLAKTPAGRIILIVWRYDIRDTLIPDFTGEFSDPPIFVITAF